MTNSITRHPLEELAEEYVTRFRSGERPPVSEYQARYPELADQIADLLQALVLLEELAPGNNEKSAADTITSEGGAQKQLGDYTILREIGRGGMGVVYEAQQESLGRHVALKVLPLHALMDPQHLKRFQREVRAAASLHHTNIVPVYGVGEQKGLHFYAMQYIQGQGLDEVLRQMRLKEPIPAENSTPKSNEETIAAKSTVSILAMTKSGTTSASKLPYFQSVARIGIQVAEALAYAHEQGIVHRDIKPSNLLLDQKQTVWVTDFGLATSEGMEELTHTGDIVGTLRYMPPERLTGWSDRRSDIYSLGLTLYELLTLHAAFDETDRARLLQQITHLTPPAPRKLDATIPRDLETIILKATSKEPGQRYLSAGDLATDLRRFIDNRPIEAKRATAWVHLRAWCRRNPAMALLSGGLAMALLLGVTGILWQNWEARQQRDSAIKQKQIALENRQQAFAAGDRLLSHIAVGTLMKMPGTEKQQRLLLEEALTFFQGFLKQDPDDPQSRREIGVAHGRLGLIYTRLGQFEAASSAFGHALGFLQPLTTEFPDNAGYQLDLASILLEQGNYFRLNGTHAQAKGSYLSALAILEKLPPGTPDRPVIRQELIRTLYNLGEKYYSAGEMTLAERYLLRDISLQEEGLRESSPDISDRLSLSKSQDALARLYIQSSRKADALAVFQKNIELMERLIREHPQESDAVDVFAALLVNMGAAYRDWGQLADAEKVMRQALVVTEKQVRRHPFAPAYQKYLGMNYANLASLFRKQGNNNEAEQNYQKAVVVFAALVENHQDAAEYRIELAGTLNNFGLFYNQTNRSVQAEPLLREALKHHEKLLQNEPDNLRFITACAGTWSNLGDVLRQARRHEEAVLVYQETIQKLEAVLIRDPKFLYAKRNLFAAYWARARSLTSLAKMEEAANDWRHVVELSEGESDMTFRLYRSLPLAYLGEHARASSEMDALLADQKILPTVLYDFACAYGLCAINASKDKLLMPAEQLQVAKRYADRAVEMLGKVHAAGELARPGRLRQLQQGSEFALVRDRADYQKIMNEVEAQLSKDKK